MESDQYLGKDIFIYNARAEVNGFNVRKDYDKGKNKLYTIKIYRISNQY